MIGEIKVMKRMSKQGQLMAGTQIVDKNDIRVRRRKTLRLELLKYVRTNVAGGAGDEDGNGAPCLI